MINRFNFYFKSFVSLIFLLNSIIFRKLIKFFNLQKFFFYPRSIYRLSKKVKTNKKIKLQNIKKLPNQTLKNKIKKDLKIKFFDKYIQINYDFPWKSFSNDIEKDCALGRWHWLIDNDFERLH